MAICLINSLSKLVPVPTYVLGPNKEEHISLYPEEESELCPNVHYLGKSNFSDFFGFDKKWIIFVIHSNHYILIINSFSIIEVV